MHFAKTSVHEKTKRTCGSCTLCCSALKIESLPGFSTRLDTGEDIAKPAGKNCVYLGPKGCTIYQVRPVLCRQFECDWLLSRKKLSLEDKPLHTNIIGVRGTEYFVK